MSTLYDFYQIEEISKERRKLIDMLLSSINSVLHENSTLENLEQVYSYVEIRNLQLIENEPK